MKMKSVIIQDEISYEGEEQAMIKGLMNSSAEQFAFSKIDRIAKENCE